MDYEFFESLTADEARAYLNRFREVEQLALEVTKAVAAKDGISFDYSLSTLPDVLKWMVKRVRVYYLPVSEEVPKWIRQAHPKGVTEFDEDSKTTILRAALYLGECFVRLPGLYWGIGDVEYMQKNMPVIAGFRDGDELPPLVVVENMFAKIAGDGRPDTEIDSAIEVWKRLCPPPSG